jgi:hypothetical protein
MLENLINLSRNRVAMTWLHTFFYVSLLLTSSVAPADGGALALDSSGSPPTVALTLTLTTLSTFTVTPMTTATTTITESPSPTSRAASLIDGRCQWDDYRGWKCRRKGFACEGNVCVDRRTPEEKEADKQDAADGKNGRCKYSYDAQSYYCTQRGFVCINETVCADHRTAKEKAEDEALRVKKAKRTAAIVGGVFGGVIGVALVMCIVMGAGEGTGQERHAGRDRAEEDREGGQAGCGGAKTRP